MEHFHLPIGIWVVGILISLFCFVTEIIVNRRRKSKSMATQEDPGETEPTSESSMRSKHMVLNYWRAARLSETEVQGKARLSVQQEVQHDNDVQDIEDTADTEET